MRTYQKVMIRKKDIIPFIQTLAKLYHESNEEVVEIPKASFILFVNDNNQDKDKQEQVSPKNKCGECKYLDICGEKRVIGYHCNRPNFHRSSWTANFKQISAPACKGFERRET